MERASFVPGRLEPCFCRSGKRFKHCCGSQDSNRKPPFSVHLIPGFVSPEACAKLVAWADTQGGDQMVIDTQSSGSDPNGGKGRQSTQRTSEEVKLAEHQSEVEQWLKKAVSQHIEPAFKRQIEWFEPPALMRYGVGGHFDRHADSEVYDPQRNLWVKIHDREISILLYLNSDFEGGLLSFPVFNWSYRPKAGDLLFFPSDSRFQHTAHPVTAGRRYAVVSWMSVLNAPKIHGGSPEGSIILNRQDGD